MSHFISITKRLTIVTAFFAMTTLNTNAHTLEKRELTSVNEPIRAIEKIENLDSAKVALGKKLFFEKKMSRNGVISCAQCHQLKNGGADQIPLSYGMNGILSRTNTPTIFNSSFQIAQGWSGHSDTVSDQIDRVVNNPEEFGTRWTQVSRALNEDPEYSKAFNRIFNDTATRKNILSALTEFIQSLQTLNAPFDQYLKGDENAISTAQKDGYRKFKEYGCTSCHNGANVGGNIFQNMGIIKDFFITRTNMSKEDLGRFQISGRKQDKHRFKVPSLRLAKLTAPYFHDGSVSTLKKAIKIMGTYQIGIDIPDEDIAVIIDFLSSLIGEYEGESLAGKQQ